MFDVIIVGAGPAGSSAALVLGRSCRRVVVYDEGRPRNARSVAVHGYLGREGVSPGELRNLALAELAPYDVEVRRARVVAARRTQAGFEVTADDGSSARGRRLLLATGVVDRLPDIPGAAELWARGLYPCVYCDGWEHRGGALGALGSGEQGFELALGLTTWSRDVVWFTNGDAPDPNHVERLARQRVIVCDDPIVRFEADGETLRDVVVTGERRIARDAVFLALGKGQASPLAEALGCNVEAEGVATGDKQRTCTPGVHLAGDAAQDVKLAIVAAAHGARAAHDINQSLREEDTRP